MAFQRILVPALQPHGFAPCGSRNLGRVSGDILQVVHLASAPGAAPRFGLSYAAWPVFRPHDAAALASGTHLRDPAGGDAWWDAGSPAAADAAMHAAGAALRWQALPWLERTRTPAGLLDALPVPAPGVDPREAFDRACCLALLEHWREAAHAAARARRLFRRDGGADWSAWIERCEQLFAATLAARVEGLFDGWRRAALRRLGLAAPGRKR